MDKKQPLVLIVIMMIFGIAIAYSLWLFGEKNIQSHKDQIILDLNHIAAHAVQYRLKPANLGGGGGSFGGYRIPEKLNRNEVASYMALAPQGSSPLVIRATSVQSLGEITAEVDSAGTVRITSQTGEFQGR